MNTQIGTSATADFEENTWTFEMKEKFEVAAGEYAIMPIEEYKRLSTVANNFRKFVDIQIELERAELKHPDYPSDMFHQLAIMQEEAGEVTKAVLHYHYEGGSKEDIKKELIQTAAMCLRMLRVL